MASTDARPIPLKNVAYRATFPILDKTGALVSGAAGLDSEVDKDKGGFNDCANEASETGSSGIYTLDLTSTEMNADTVTVVVKTSTTDARPTVLVYNPQELGDILVDVQSWAGGSLAMVNTSGVPIVDVGYVGGHAVPVSGYLEVDVVKFGGGDGSFSAGRPQVNTMELGGLGIGATAGATSAGTITFPATISAPGDAMALTSGERTTLAAAIWNALTSGIATANSIGKRLLDFVTSLVYTAPDNTAIAAIKAKTDNLPSDPADASDIAAAFSTVNGTLGTIAGYIDTEVAAIKAKTDNLPSDPADASDIAAAFSTVNGTLGTIAGYIDTEVAAIKAKTDNLPASPAAASDIPSAATIAGAVNTALSNTHGAGSWEDAGGGGGGDGFTDDDRTTLETIAETVAAGSGSGAYPITVTVTDGTNPLQSAKVRVTEGVNTFTATTDASGLATFALDAATYAVAVTKSGYSFTPTTRTVTGDEAGTLVDHLAMTLTAIPAAGDPTQTTGYLYTRDGHGALLGGVTVTFELLTAPGSDSFPHTAFTAASDEDGELTVLLQRRASYRARRDGGRWISFTAGNGDTYHIPQILGAQPS